MRKFIRSSRFCFAAFFLFFSAVFSQTNFWESTNGPPGGRVNSIFVNSNGDIYVSTGVGIFRSVDNGQSWVQSVIPSKWPEVKAVTVSKTGALYAAGDYVYRSTDNGATWRQIMNGFPNGVGGCIVLSSNGDIFAACSSNAAAVYRSTDDGDSWTYLNDGLPLQVQSMVISPGGTILAGTQGGVFRSTNNGDNWSQVNAGLTSTYVSSMIVKPNGEIFAAAGYVHRSTDDGKHWALCDSSFGVSILSVDSNGTLCGASWDGKVYRSTDDGNTWVDISGDLGTQSTTSVALGYGRSDFSRHL
jgi:photosystem II stability/assembly factor-like uncharacterized protein